MINYDTNKINEYQSIPFWSWNDDLDEKKLIHQIDWMNENGIGGFFMHARSGLKTEYLSNKWMSCVEACITHAHSLGMKAWVYDENGWPSGFAGGKLLADCNNHDKYLTCSIGEYDSNSLVSYLIDKDELIRVSKDGTGMYLNIFDHMSSSTADILNPDVTDKFISLTHEQYKRYYGEYFSEKLEGFFTDEPQYYRWGMPYTETIRKYFTNKLHEDILDGIGLLFLKKNGYKKFRYQYWSGMQNLLINNFSKRVYDWCDKNNVKLTGHYIEESSLAGQMMCCAGIMPLYEYEHIPGIDWLGRNCDQSLSARQVSSVAVQLGKKRVLCEMYACCGWDVTPRELKKLTQFLYLNGINLTCHHLIPYSESGNRIHDYPAHYSDINPWVKYYFKEYNDYFTKLSALISNSYEEVHVAVLHPIRSAYFDYKPDEEDKGYGISEIDKMLYNVVDQLDNLGINYHFIDEVLLKKYGRVEDNQIFCGRCKYDFLILPNCITMDKSTEVLLRKYIINGGKILLIGKKPEYIEWKPFDYPYVKNNTTWQDILDSCPIKSSYVGGKLRVSYRSCEKGDFLFVINHSDNECCKAKFILPDGYISFKRISLLNDKCEIVSTELNLNPGESAILIPSNSISKKALIISNIYPKNVYDVISSDENALVIDKISYSTNGINFSPLTSVPFVFKKLLKKRFNGKLYLEYNFYIKIIPELLHFSTEMTGIEKILVNGIELDGSIHKSDENIAYMLVIGKNTIQIQLNYYQDKKVYDVLFGENITESLKNCLVYNSEIEPLILKGNFGVYETKGFIKGNDPNVLLGNSFFISTPKKVIKSFVKDGYPFFSGKVTLHQNFYCDGSSTRLVMLGRWHVCEVIVNHTKLGHLLLTNYIDISSVVKKGINELELKMIIGNRNLYGPHHYAKAEEPIHVGPEHFEFFDTEKEKGLSYYRESMSFVEPMPNYNKR